MKAAAVSSDLLHLELKVLKELQSEKSFNRYLFKEI